MISSLLFTIKSFRANGYTCRLRNELFIYKKHEIIVPNRFNFSLIFLQNSYLIWFTIYITRVLYSYTLYHTFSCHGPIIHEANTHYQPKPCNVSVLIWHCYESLFGSSNHRNQCWFNKFSLVKEAPDTKYQNIYTIVWFFRALRWYIGPPAMPVAAVTRSRQ